MLGEIVGSYKIIEQIGEGGMGVVYRGEHKMLGRAAAIKVLLREYAGSSNIVQRFFNEAKAATAIKHPGIVEVFDFGNHADGSPFIIMEFLRGEPLHARLFRDKKLESKVAIEIMSQVASALGAAHAEGIIHRDLKPDNIFLVPDELVDIGVRIKLLDFGIAKLDEELRGGLEATRAGAVLGTPQYMSPEQCMGSTDVDHRADLYALGCLLFHMLCGRPPFLEEEFGKIAIQHMTQAPPKPSVLEPSISPQLEQTVMRLLEKAPEDRFQSCGQLIAALEGRPPRAATPVPKPIVAAPTDKTKIEGTEAPAGEPPAKRRTAVMSADSSAPAPAPTPAPEASKSAAESQRGSEGESGPNPMLFIAIAAVVAIAAIGFFLLR